MSHMKAQITIKMDWLELDTDCGIWFVPFGDLGLDCSAAAVVSEVCEDGCQDTADKLLQYTEGTRLDGVRLVRGYGVRLSAPGYLDCTDWDVYPNKRDAWRAYRELERDEE